jgi:hypothetical protein
MSATPDADEHGRSGDRSSAALALRHLASHGAPPTATLSWLDNSIAIRHQTAGASTPFTPREIFIKRSPHTCNGRCSPPLASFSTPHQGSSRTLYSGLQYRADLYLTNTSVNHILRLYIRRLIIFHQLPEPMPRDPLEEKDYQQKRAARATGVPWGHQPICRPTILPARGPRGIHRGACTGKRIRARRRYASRCALIVSKANHP